MWKCWEPTSRVPGPWSWWTLTWLWPTLLWDFSSSSTDISSSHWTSFYSLLGETLVQFCQAMRQHFSGYRPGMRQSNVVRTWTCRWSEYNDKRSFLVDVKSQSELPTLCLCAPTHLCTIIGSCVHLPKFAIPCLLIVHFYQSRSFDLGASLLNGLMPFETGWFFIYDISDEVL